MAGRRRKKSNSKAGIVLAAVAVVAVLAVILYFVTRSGDGKEERLGKDILISGVDVSSMTYQEALFALKETEDKLAAEYEITLTYNEYSRTANAQDLGITFDTDELIKKAKSGDRLEITPSFSQTAIEALAQEAAEAIDTQVKEPGVEAFDFDTLTFTLTPGQEGISLNQASLSEEITSFLDTTKKGELPLEPEIISPETTLEELENSFGQISTYSTECTNNANSEHNMRLAMEYMDQTVIEAGAVFSFNETTGDSTTAEGGWVQSGAWVQGKLQDQYGGGICQAASTFYNAALLGNMEVVERWEHMQPANYCTEGLDATIDYPNLDLKMRNITDYPIYVVSKMIDKTLTVTLYGYISPEFDHIETSGWYTETIPMPAAEFETDESMGEGEYVLERQGYAGSKAEAQRQWIAADGSVLRTEALPSSSYSAVAPLYKIGPNTDTGAIPQGSESGVATFPTEPSGTGGSGQGEITAHTDPDQVRG
jgi:vancomycin resistance protein YoaR